MEWPPCATRLCVKCLRVLNVRRRVPCPASDDSKVQRYQWLIVEGPGIEPSTEKAASRSFLLENRPFASKKLAPSCHWIPRRSVLFRGVGKRFGARSCLAMVPTANVSISAEATCRGRFHESNPRGRVRRPSWPGDVVAGRLHRDLACLPGIRRLWRAAHPNPRRFGYARGMERGVVLTKPRSETNRNIHPFGFTDDDVELASTDDEVRALSASVKRNERARRGTHSATSAPTKRRARLTSARAGASGIIT